MNLFANYVKDLACLNLQNITVLLCEDCHKQIHALYTNKELAMRLNTLEKLKCDYKIEKYLKYVKKQCPSKKLSIKKSREVRKKSKR